MSPAPPGDYHVHTSFSDGEGEPAQCVERALALGLPEIGITDHLTPSVLDAEGAWSIGHERLGEYVGAVRDAAARYPEITVLLGVEADYVPGTEDELAGLLGAYPFDYVVGGLHYVDGFSFDDEATREDPRWDAAASLYRRYYALLGRAAASGLFDVLAHFDYVMLWGRRTDEDVSAVEDEALAVMAAHGRRREVVGDADLRKAQSKGPLHALGRFTLAVGETRMDVVVAGGRQGHGYLRGALPPARHTRYSCTNPSRSPSSTPWVLPTSYPVRRSLTIWYGCRT